MGGAERQSRKGVRLLVRIKQSVFIALTNSTLFPVHFLYMKGTSLRNWTRKCAVKKFRRHLKVIILSILLLLLLLYGLRSSFSCGWSWPTGDEDAEFYDFEVLENSHNKHPEYMSTLLPNNQKIEEDGSRIINTTNGIVVVKDFQFTPHRRLPEGENVFKRAGASSIARQAGRRSGISDVDLGRKRPVPEIPHQQDFIYMLEESEGEDQLGVELKKMSKFTKKGVFHSEHRDKSWIHHLGNSLTAINKRGNYQGNDDLKSPTQKGYPQGLNSWEFGKKNSVSDSKQEERKYIFGRHWQPTKPHQNTIASPTLKKQSNCPYLPCPNYLNQEDLARFEDCQRKSNLYYERSEPQATKCRFRKGYSITSYYLAALASSPSAGIDRLRSILQETTGICTGSDTCDTDLRLKGMAGENVVSTAVLVVKTNAFPSVHDNVQLPVPRTSSKHDAVPVYDSVIFVLRNPYQFMLEEWSRRHSHGGTGTGEYLC